MTSGPVEPPTFYVTGGPLGLVAPSYIERAADRELYSALRRGELCYVLTPRQMGKSSLLARTAARLRADGVLTAAVDLNEIGSEASGLSPATWYLGLVNAIDQRLRPGESVISWWNERRDLSPVQRFSDYFRELLLPSVKANVAIFIDEIDSTLGLRFTNDFFAVVRAAFTARATAPEYERLTFTLLGVATPEQLIRDTSRTPFNVGRRIDLDDFTASEARPLAALLHSDPAVAQRRLDLILAWTSGYPYLTQKLCREAAEEERRSPGRTDEAVVDTAVERALLSPAARREEVNFSRARDLIIRPRQRARAKLQVYLQVRRGAEVFDQPQSQDIAQLKLSGVIRVSPVGRLSVRNRIYAAVFSEGWARSEMPADLTRRGVAALAVATLATVTGWYAFLEPRPYIEAIRTATAADSWQVAAQAYDHLHRNRLFPESRARELLAEFWDHRELLYAAGGNREAAILSALQAISANDTRRRRQQAAALIGADDRGLEATLHLGVKVDAAALSPDGQLLAVAAADGSLQACDLESRRRYFARPSHEPRESRESHFNLDDSFEGVAVSSDKTLVAAERVFDTVVIWNIQTGEVHEFSADTGVRGLVALDARSKSVWIGANSGLAERSLSGGALRFVGTPGQQFPDILLSADARLALVTNWRNGVHMVDLSAPLSSWQEMKGAPSGYPAACGGGTGHVIFSSPGGLEVWDALHLKKMHSFARIRGRVLACSEDAAEALVQLMPLLYVIDNDKGTAVHAGISSSFPMAAGFGKKGQIVAVYGTGVVRVSRAFSDSSSVGSQLTAERAVVSRDGRRLVTVSKGGFARVFDGRSGRLIARQHWPADGDELTLSDDGSIAAFSQGGSVAYLDTNDGRVLRQLHVCDEESVVQTIDHEGDQALVYCRGQYFIVRRTSAVIRSLPRDFDAYTAAFSGDNARLAAGGLGSLLWYDLDAKTYQRGNRGPDEGPQRLPRPNGIVSALEIGSTRSRLVFGTSDGQLGVATTDDARKLQREINVGDFVRQIAEGNAPLIAVQTSEWLIILDRELHPIAAHCLVAIPGEVVAGSLRFTDSSPQRAELLFIDDDDHFHWESFGAEPEAKAAPISGSADCLLRRWEYLLDLKFDRTMKVIPGDSVAYAAPPSCAP
jgi:WD40 repeat protein